MLVLFAVIILCITSIGGVIYLQTGSALEAETADELEQSTQLQSNVLAESIDRYQHHVRTLAESNVINSGTDGEIELTLESEVSSAPDSVVAAHYIETDDYEVLISSDDEAEGVSFADEGVDWATDDTLHDGQSGIHLTDPYDDPVTDNASIAITSSVPEDSDRGVVFVIDQDDHASELASPSLEDDAFTQIVNEDGEVVMSHDDEAATDEHHAVDDEDDPRATAIESGLEGETGYLESDVGGSEMALGYAPVDGTDWVIMAHTPMDAAYDLHQSVTRSVIALVLVSLLGLGTIGVVVGRNMSRSLNELTAKTREVEQGNLETELESDRIDEIGELYAAFRSMRDSLRETLHEVNTAKKRAERREQTLEVLVEQLEQEASDVMKQAAEGDLTQRMDVEEGNEAIEQVAAEYNEMIERIETTIDDPKRFAGDVASHSEQVTANVEEVQAASEQVSTAVQDISSHIDHQHTMFRSAAGEMAEIEQMADDIASLSESVSHSATQTAAAGEEGRSTARNAKEAMSRIDEESKQTLREIEKLEQQMAEIEEIVDMISEHAAQTDLLALSANIEASRQTTETTEFGTVAAEVKELARETKESAAEIDTIIASLESQLERTTREVETTRSEIDESKAVIEETVDTLESIATYTTSTSSGVQQIASLSQQQSDSTQDARQLITNATELSEQVTAETETVAAATEEQTSSLEEVTTSANQLASEAQSLHTTLDYFETAADDEPDHHFKFSHGTLEE
ncbi:methyl-accepting chemotaxis protein [Natronorubrum daqingense]|uniref:Methyl-accepting chemotaxis protein n=2 Tax=Natronorubrum daqingense TaxID=588898 RepID=A0A1N7BQA6_9EURY|nr:hypothetical protein BB347_07945 [Natronorubrum daqingense]SIR53446.1 methyl-accepting chemotaxis protein [Natronorubrum daqingense]